MNNVIEINNLSIEYQMVNANLKAVNNVSLQIKKGCITGLVGESGSGKSTLAAGLLNALTKPGKIVSGSIDFIDDVNKFDVVKLDLNELSAYRWKQISMVFQGAQSSLNPVMKIKDQFYETMKVHSPNVTYKQAYEKFVSLMEYVNLDAERVLNAYPHEISGGMKQRTIIAFALLLEPKVIILDEPTTALDIITQDYIFKILQKINKQKNISMILLTHDIAVVSKFADYVGVMYGGRIVEYGTVESVFINPMHPYSRGLLAATPSIFGDIDKMKPIKGSPPNILDLKNNCSFNNRCDKCMNICLKKIPEPVKLDDSHIVSCHLYKEQNDE